jgi:hypothetical protein
MPSKLKVELDLEDPYHDRVDDRGTGARLQLNADERRMIQEREIIAKAIYLLTEDKKEVSDIAESLGLDTAKLREIGKRHSVWREAMAQRCAEMFLTINGTISRQEIAKALDMSETTLRRFTRSEEFQTAYNEIFANVTEDPLPRTVQLMVQERFLPKAIEVLDEMLTKPGVPWSVKQKAQQDVFKLAGIEQVERRENDRAEAAKFLAEIGVIQTGDQYNIIIPPEYQDAMNRFGVDVVEGEVSRLPDKQPADQSQNISDSNTEQ